MQCYVLVLCCVSICDTFIPIFNFCTIQGYCVKYLQFGPVVSNNTKSCLSGHAPELFGKIRVSYFKYARPISSFYFFRATLHFLLALRVLQIMCLVLLGSLRFTRFSHFLSFLFKKFYFSSG